MRSLALSIVGLGLMAAACSSSSGAVTDDSSEINTDRGALEREIVPPIAIPKTALIGAKLTDVLAEAKLSTLTADEPTVSDDCTSAVYRDENKKAILERTVCDRSELVRFLDDDGKAKAEHADLNKDGKVDRFTGNEGSVEQYVDNNFDGKVDTMIERVEKVKDFSLDGYEEDFPQTAFLHRVREDRNRDGKFDYEQMTARGVLPKKE